VSDGEILALAKKHFHQATDGKTPPDCGRWRDWAVQTGRAVDGFSNTTEVIHFGQDRMKVPFTHRGKANAELILHCGWIISAEFPAFEKLFSTMKDNPESILGSYVFVGDGKYSDIMLWHTWSLLTCQSHVPDIRSVIEIGGGDGSLARLWQLYFPVKRYVIVDLPESLFFAEVVLRKEFGYDVGYFDGGMPNAAKILLVPVDLLDQYKEPSDIVVNIGSMQEMNDEWINHYMRWLDQHKTNYFYSLNYAAQPITALKESRCYWGPRPSRRWSPKLLALDPTLIRIMCYGRHFLQALYERKPCQDSIRSWSVFRGHDLTLTTYLEGLDLIRQCPLATDIELFMETVLANCSFKMLPKEMVALAEMVDCEASKTVLKYRGENSRGWVD
jgi:putative sugar O-methyltransferase